MNASRKVILIPDTSWLMEIGKQNRNYLLEFVKQEPENRIIKIHNRVFKELDALKKAEDKSSQSRMASQFIEEVLKQYPESLKIDNFNINIPDKKFKDSISSETDAIVLTLAEKSKREGEVLLVTTDRNQRMLAEINKIQNGEKFASEINEVTIGVLFIIWLFISIICIKTKLYSLLFFITFIIVFFIPIRKENFTKLSSNKREEEEESLSMWDCTAICSYDYVGGKPARDYLFDDDD